MPVSLATQPDRWSLPYKKGWRTTATASRRRAASIRAPSSWSRPSSAIFVPTGSTGALISRPSPRSSGWALLWLSAPPPPDIGEKVTHGAGIEGGRYAWWRTLHLGEAFSVEPGGVGAHRKASIPSNSRTASERMGARIARLAMPRALAMLGDELSDRVVGSEGKCSSISQDAGSITPSKGHRTARW